MCRFFSSLWLEDLPKTKHQSTTGILKQKRDRDKVLQILTIFKSVFTSNNIVKKRAAQARFSTVFYICLYTYIQARFFSHAAQFKN